MVTVTEAAKKKFLEIVQAEGRPDQGLRVIVRNGGTVRPEFGLNFVGPEQHQSDDVVVDAGAFKIHIDPDSAKYLRDAKVDFVERLTESGFLVEAPHAGIPKPSGPVAEAVQRVLEERINPAVATHGGHVALVAVENDAVYLQFGGGCQGCGMVNVTLKQGVERVLLAEVPGLQRVLDVTDHAAGTNPYYQPSK
ncbi:MAG TPA: iron-sulfur cluster assembly accessory protein [Candidatus Polarisedimenticolaceae bacterium]|nr:iron-sulfur cluster assembly accessory protein [Candidatus Polarisedimenticolaceae bacterium]